MQIFILRQTRSLRLNTSSDVLLICDFFPFILVKSESSQRINEIDRGTLFLTRTNSQDDSSLSFGVNQLHINTFARSIGKDCCAAQNKNLPVGGYIQLKCMGQETISVKCISNFLLATKYQIQRNIFHGIENIIIHLFL